MSDHLEIGRRARVLIDRCPSHLQGVWFDDVWVNRNSAYLMVHIGTGNMVYIEDAHTGKPMRWDSSLFAETLKTLREHMILDELADV